VRWFDGVPLIQLSDREKSLAVCWYTLFHEIGHVLLHENDTIFEGEIDVPKSIASQKETEANAYAYGKLFNGDELRKYVFGKRGESVHDTFISDTASFFNVPVIFVAYWSLKAQIGNRMGKKYIPDIAFDTVT
jgi:Zn-dependent peptidase ImmA (M78 family)